MAHFLPASLVGCFRVRPTRFIPTLAPHSTLQSAIRFAKCPLCRPITSKAPGVGRQGRPWNKRVVVAGAKPQDVFLAEEGTSFESLGIDAEVSEALLRAGFSRPAKVQAIGIPKLFEGADFLLGAETGSGKTLAYLAPLVSKVVQRNRKTDGVKSTTRALRSFALVLCPNGTLCKQVKSMADSLMTSAGDCLAYTEMAHKVIGDSSNNPDIVIATPAGLLSSLRDLDRDYANDWLAGVGQVIFDEADMLMTGGYSPKVKILVGAFRMDERSIAYEYLAYALGLSEEEVRAIPKHQRKAAVQGGIQEMLNQGYKPKQQVAREALQKFLAKGSRPLGRPPWHRQYVFVAATVPSDATRNIASDIRQICPGVEWATSRGLHKTLDTVEHEWVDVSKSNPWEELLKALDRGAGGRTLVFTQDVLAAENVWNGISSAGFNSVLYHSKMRSPDSTKSLRLFRQTPNMIMVCTDSASRGLDVPNVACVIQADFATSAVDFLHRVGRTGRAGTPGNVVSLFREGNRDLVNAIRDAMDKGEPIEGAFSRKRSFRKKFKRYGRYVPRGATAPTQKFSS